MKKELLVTKAIADRNRLRIIKLLQSKPMCVCELTAVLGIAQPSVSRHLRVLKDAGLVRDKRKGSWIDYLLDIDSDDTSVTQILSILERWLEDDPQIEADRAHSCRVSRTELLGNQEE